MCCAPGPRSCVWNGGFHPFWNCAGIDMVGEGTGSRGTVRAGAKLITVAAVDVGPDVIPGHENDAPSETDAEETRPDRRLDTAHWAE